MAGHVFDWHPAGRLMCCGLAGGCVVRDQRHVVVSLACVPPVMPGQARTGQARTGQTVGSSVQQGTYGYGDSEIPRITACSMDSPTLLKVSGRGY